LAGLVAFFFGLVAFFLAGLVAFFFGFVAFFGEDFFGDDDLGALEALALDLGLDDGLAPDELGLAPDELGLADE